jgi:glycyl-tRNA synthetase
VPHRGFIFPSAEIYGGFRSTYDYGPLGVNMLRNVKNAWWRSMVQLRDDVVGLDAAILSPPAVWEASGHLATFTDPLVDCRNCHERWREDKIDGVCPNCGSTDLTEARAFNLMFKTTPARWRTRATWPTCGPRRPRACSLNFANVLNTTRKKPPFGIAQVGKSFRNEITPQNFVFRTREFEQMEMEYFVPPAESQQWFEYWLAERFRWYLDLGIPEEKLRLRHHEPSELSHYSRGTADVEFLFPWGWDELEGIANRGDFDLTAHAKASGEKLDYFDPADQRALRAPRDRAGRRRHPDDDGLPALRLRRGRGGRRGAHVLRLHWRLAPYQVAVLPLSKKDPSSRSPARCSPACSRTSCATTTPPRASASATGARTRWGRPGASPSTSTRWRTTPSPCATATPPSRSGCPSTIWSPSCAAAPARSRPHRRLRLTCGTCQHRERHQDDQQADDPGNRAYHRSCSSGRSRRP